MSLHVVIRHQENEYEAYTHDRIQWLTLETDEDERRKRSSGSLATSPGRLLRMVKPGPERKRDSAADWEHEP